VNYLLKRIGLILYGLLSIMESVANTSLYISHLDAIRKPFDLSLPFYFWYVNKFLKGSYIADLKDKHG